MAKAALIAVLFVALISASFADRSLAQDKNANKNGPNKQQGGRAKPVAGGKVRPAQVAEMMDCGGAQQLGKSANDNLCCPLCWCLGNQNAAFAGDAIQKLCKTKCAQCVVDAQKCKSADADLPASCQEGLQFNSVVKALFNKCAAMYLTDKSAASRAQGC